MRKYQKILIIGAGGGREHAIGWKVAQSERAGKLFFARGNAGTAKIGTNLDIKETDISALLDFAKKEDVDLALVVADDPLAVGVVDEFKKAGFRVWGPTKRAAQIEWSKAYSKEFMRRHNLPTAKFEVFNNFEKAKEYIEKQSFPIVIKADGLALGKGVVIAQSLEEAQKTLEDIMVKKIFGDSGNEVVIEEFLTGPEFSVHTFSDGKNYKIFPPSQDHKRIGEDDEGPNTAGIGVISPLPFIDENMIRKVEEEIITPTLKGMAEEGSPFEGILYPGLMLTADGPKIIEFNSRIGDPEAQTYMRLLETDLLDIVDACIDQRLDELEVEWKTETPLGKQVFACSVALVSQGYPGNYEKGKLISGMEEAEKQPDIVIFHSGTKLNEEGNLVTNGGRVLWITAVGNTLEYTLKKAYQAAEKIHFDGVYYRKDIGQKALTTTGY